MGNRAGVGAAVVVGKLVVGEFFELRACFSQKNADDEIGPVARAKRRIDRNTLLLDARTRGLASASRMRRPRTGLADSAQGLSMVAVLERLLKVGHIYGRLGS